MVVDHNHPPSTPTVSDKEEGTTTTIIPSLPSQQQQQQQPMSSLSQSPLPSSNGASGNNTGSGTGLFEGLTIASLSPSSPEMTVRAAVSMDHHENTTSNNNNERNSSSTTTTNAMMATTTATTHLQRTPVVSNRANQSIRSSSQSGGMIDETRTNVLHTPSIRKGDDNNNNNLDHLSLPLTTTTTTTTTITGHGSSGSSDGTLSSPLVPVTDKLMELLDQQQQQQQKETTTTLTAAVVPMNQHNHMADQESIQTTTTTTPPPRRRKDDEGKSVQSSSVAAATSTAVESSSSSSSYGSFLTGWFGSSGSSSTTTTTTTTPSTSKTISSTNEPSTLTVVKPHGKNKQEKQEEEEDVVLVENPIHNNKNDPQQQEQQSESFTDETNMTNTTTTTNNTSIALADSVPPPPPPPTTITDVEVEEPIDDEMPTTKDKLEDVAVAATSTTMEDLSTTTKEEEQQQQQQVEETPRKKKMEASDQQALDEAFESTEGDATVQQMTTTVSKPQQPYEPEEQQQKQEPPPVQTTRGSGDAEKENDEQLSTAVTVHASNVSADRENDDNEEEEEDEEPHPTASQHKPTPPYPLQTPKLARTGGGTTTTTTTSDRPPLQVVASGSGSDTIRTLSLPQAIMDLDRTLPRIRGLGQVHPDTPVRNADVCLRVLRKFARKTRPRIATTYGGQKSLGLYGFFFANKEDPTFVPYKILMDILYENDDHDGKNENHSTNNNNNNHHHNDHSTNDEEDDSETTTDHIVQGIMGESGDTMDRARRAISAFVFVFSSWGHASAHEYAAAELKDTKSRESFHELLSAVLNCASALVAHGCLDHVVLIIGNEGVVSGTPQAEAVPVVHLLTQSVLAADLNPEHNELAAMKFILSAGCRNVVDPSILLMSDDDDDNKNNNNNNELVSSSSLGGTLLGGSHLLQTVRMLYHIFLTTESTANKITARAALQQLVTHVFGRMVATDQAQQVLAVTSTASSSTRKTTEITTTRTTTRTTTTPDGFPSEHHRNAFLILRAICKLSMRNLPDGASGMHAHIGFQSSGSNETWDGHQHQDSSDYYHHGYYNNHHDSSSSLTGGIGSSHTPTTTTTTDLHRDPHHPHHAQLIYTAAIHPALESKILALDLLHYVLTHTQFPTGFVQRSGPQFHACLRNYLCVSLLKNCTSSETTVVNWSLRIFVPTVRNFRAVLKTEIEAFVTNVFFVILDSKHSTADHKGIVVRTFDEICSDPVTLAEIFLNYDCDLSAVDLFHRIVQTLSRVSRTGLVADVIGGIKGSGGGGGGGGGGPSSFSSGSSTSSGAGSSVFSAFLGPSTAARMEKIRFETRELRLDAMKALRQVLASLHASIVEPMSSSSSSSRSKRLPASSQTGGGGTNATETPRKTTTATMDVESMTPASSSSSPSQIIIPPPSPNNDDDNDTSTTPVRNPVEVYDSKKKRRAQESEAVLRFNQKPVAGLNFATQCGHVNGEDPIDVARYLLTLQDVLDKTMIGEYLGREAEYQNGFSICVLHEYIRLFDFTGLLFDEAIRYFLSGFRLPGEAQKVSLYYLLYLYLSIYIYIYDEDD